VFSRDGVIARSVGDWATTLMPIAILAGWVALTLYTLTLPLPTDARAAAEVRGATRAAAAPAPPSPASAAPAPRAKGPARKGEDVAPAPAPVAGETTAPEQTGLAALFRRAINAPPTETAGTAETVRP